MVPQFKINGNDAINQNIHEIIVSPFRSLEEPTLKGEVVVRSHSERFFSVARVPHTNSIRVPWRSNLDAS